MPRISYELPRDGKKIQTERDAVDLIGEAASAGADIIIVPVERLHDDFFQLKTRTAGEIAQKFVQYRRRLVILGDISRYVAESSAFAAFVQEANQGADIWFVTDIEELAARLPL